MAFTVIAIAVGAVLGLLTGGRPSNIGRRPLQLVSLLVVSVAAQVVAETIDIGDTLALSVVLVSYVGLSAFAVANIRLVGMPVVLVGLLCNLTVIALNGGMPVRASAIVDARVAGADELSTLDFGAKRHLAEGDDRLMVLADIIPVRAIGTGDLRLRAEVISFGDLILAFGVADVLFRLLRPLDHRRRRSDADDDVVIDLDEQAASRRSDELVSA